MSARIRVLSHTNNTNFLQLIVVKRPFFTSYKGRFLQLFFLPLNFGHLSPQINAWVVNEKARLFAIFFVWFSFLATRLCLLLTFHAYFDCLFSSQLVWFSSSFCPLCLRFLQLHRLKKIYWWHRRNADRSSRSRVTHRNSMSWCY